MRVHEMYEADRRDHIQPPITAGQLRVYLEGVDDDAPVVEGMDDGALMAVAERWGRLELYIDPNTHTP